MAVCAAYRMPHSEFLAWSSADRDKAIWWQIRKAQTCAGCGTRAEEWDPAAGGHRRAYGVEERVCAGCEVLQRAQDQAQHDVPLRGGRLVLVPRGGPR